MKSYTKAANSVFLGKPPLEFEVNKIAPLMVEVTVAASTKGEIQFEDAMGKMIPFGERRFGKRSDIVCSAITNFFERVRIVHVNDGNDRKQYAVINRGQKIQLAELAI